MIVFGLSNETCFYMCMTILHIKGGYQASPCVNEEVSLNMGPRDGEMAH